MHKDSNRPRRVAELLHHELARLLPRELDAPIVHRVTLTGVEVSPDLTHARIYFSLLAGSMEAKAAAAVLNEAAGHLRHVLRDRVRLKRGVPQLKFVFDESLERGARMDALIARAVSEDNKK
jgi:ribosome-binding factor A